MQKSRFVKIITSIIAAAFLLAILIWLIVGVVIPILLPLLLRVSDTGSANMQTNAALSPTSTDSSPTINKPSNQTKPSDETKQLAGGLNNPLDVVIPRTSDQLKNSDSNSITSSVPVIDQNSASQPISIYNRGSYDDFVSAYTI